MESSFVWVKAIIIMGLLIYLSRYVLQYLNDYYKQKFYKYLESEQRKNPHVYEKPLTF